MRTRSWYRDMFGSIRAVSSWTDIHTRWSFRYFNTWHANTFTARSARKSNRMKEKNKNWPVHHETFLIQLYLSTQPSWDIRCYINSASLFGNPSPRKLLQPQQRSTISDTEQKKCLGSRHFAPVPPWPRYTGSSAAPAPSICYVGFPPIFPPFHSTSTVVEHYARYAATRWKPTSLFSPPPLRVMSALSIFWRH